MLAVLAACPAASTLKAAWVHCEGSTAASSSSCGRIASTLNGLEGMSTSIWLRVTLGLNLGWCEAKRKNRLLCAWQSQLFVLRGRACHLALQLLDHQC